MALKRHPPSVVSRQRLVGPGQHDWGQGQHDWGQAPIVLAANLRRHAREERPQRGKRRVRLVLQQQVRGARDHDLVGVGQELRQPVRRGGRRRAVELAREHEHG